jgi:hypothetical protein
MEESKSTLTILFQEPFWIGLYEREREGKYEVCKITFGSEPKDYEVFEFMLENWPFLRFSPSIRTQSEQLTNVNPKRLQRLIKKQLQNTGIGTKAQQALKMQQEQQKTVRKEVSRERRDEEKQLRYELQKTKQKEKHKGH